MIIVCFTFFREVNLRKIRPLLTSWIAPEPMTHPSCWIAEARRTIRLAIGELPAYPPKGPRFHNE